jgi:hypothetical protein
MHLNFPVEWVNDVFSDKEPDSCALPVHIFVGLIYFAKHFKEAVNIALTYAKPSIVNFYVNCVLNRNSFVSV